MEHPPINFLEEISNFVFLSKYSRYNDKLGRRETWGEAVSRVENMHLKKYDFLAEPDKQKIRNTFDLVRDKRAVPSMRSLQFGGKAIEAKNERIYNCAVRHIDSLRAFAEVFYLLLCGCGVGLGISKYFSNRLPDLVNEKDKTGAVLTYTLQDSIEGWADSVEVLLMCYFKNTPLTGRKIVFDYSKIRPEGSLLRTGGGKAPGYKGLKFCHKKIKELLDHVIEYKYQTRLKSVDVYDILMHCADSVLSGGVRRSSTSVIFDKDDIDMINAKAKFKVEKVFAFHCIGEETLGGTTNKLYEGKINFEGSRYEIQVKDYELEDLQKNNLVNWKHLFPQRARSNNSVLLLRDNTTEKEFSDIVERTKQYGEPGFVWGNHSWQLFNPCFTKEQRVLTIDGWRSFELLLDTMPTILQDNRVVGSIRNNIEEWDFNFENKELTENIANKVYKTGENQKIFKLVTQCYREVEATENHHFATKRGMIELKDLQIGDKILVPINKIYHANFNSFEWKLGFIYGHFYGDGTTDKNVILEIWSNNSNKLSYIEKIVKDIIEHEKSYLKIENNSKIKPKFYIAKTEPTYIKYRLESVLLKQIFEKYKIYNKNDLDNLHFFNKDFKSGFISGFIDTDGHIDFHNKSRSLSIRITQSNLKCLQNIMLILQELGVFSKVNNLKPAGMVKFKKDIKSYYCKQSYRLIIPGVKNCNKLFNFIILFDDKKHKFNKISNSLQTNRDVDLFATIKSIEYIKNADVFCLKEDNRRTCIVEGLTTRRCFEIGFIPVTKDGICGVQFCNLTSQNGRKITSKEEFKECVTAATIIGTLQVGYTNFPYLSKVAEELTKEESLLGVSITGIMDNPDILLDYKLQKEMSELAVKINKEWSKKIHVNIAARVTCLKPEGTTSLVLGTGSGIHPHHSRRYFRRVMANKLENVYRFFKKHNPKLSELSVWSATKTDDVICFPIQVSNKAIIKKDLSAIQHLECVKFTQQNWVLGGISESNTKPIEHNVSCTITVKDNEWDNVIKYIYSNRQFFAAISFIPYGSDKVYAQAPMEDIVNENDENNWKTIIDNFNHVDYKQLKENDDNTTPTQEIVCAGGACEII